MKKADRLHIKFFLIIPFAIVISYLAAHFPSLVERLYAAKLYRIIGPPLSRLTGIIPFSLGEIIVISFLFFIFIGVIRLLRLLVYKHTNKTKIFANYFKVLLISIGLIYFVFVFIWGLNYHRMPFSTIAGLDVRPSSVEELNNLCLSLIERTNALRSSVAEDEKGIMKLPKGIPDMFLRAPVGFSRASRDIPALGGTYGRPKGVLFSKAMSHTGIAGIYFPFTAEANVNIDIPEPLLPSTTCHEMAHQRGFAREDEANYIAYLTSTMHPDVDFQYSGTLLALIHSMNALYTHDPNRYVALKSLYSPAVQRDLVYHRQYWERYEGPIERATTKINDAYLKSNLQEDGVHSYGRMVDLLLAEYRAKNGRM